MGSPEKVKVGVLATPQPLDYAMPTPWKGTAMAISDESDAPAGEGHGSKGETPSQPSRTERATTWLVGVSKLLAAVIAIGGPGFALGRFVEEAKGHEAIAAIRAELTAKTAALESANIDSSASARAYQTLQLQLVQKDAQITQLTEATRRGRDCDYLRQQIELTNVTWHMRSIR